MCYMFIKVQAARKQYTKKFCNLNLLNDINCARVWPMKTSLLLAP